MDSYALIGKPLEHSFSQKYFRQKFSQEGISADYVLNPLKRIGQLPEWIATSPQLKGFNVTMPYKESILPFLDTLADSAKRCGNVNCVKVIRQNGRTELVGYNTDYHGFTLALEECFDVSRFRRAALLGSGGAAKTVKIALETLGIECHIASRTPKSELRQISYKELNNSIRDYQLIVNTTPVGMFPNVNQMPPIELEHLSSEHCVFDLIYNPTETLLLESARKKGAKTSNGYRMLCLQADKAWEIWQEN